MTAHKLLQNQLRRDAVEISWSRALGAHCEVLRGPRLVSPQAPRKAITRAGRRLPPAASVRRLHLAVL